MFCFVVRLDGTTKGGGGGGVVRGMIAVQSFSTELAASWSDW